MGLCVVFVSGVAKSGKSTLVQAMIDRCFRRPPHYLRLFSSDECTNGNHRPGARAPRGVASARGLRYDAERIFEVLPEALTGIHQQDRFGSVLIEGDTDACLLHAYPYDFRIFMMPVPLELSEVFRDPELAACELQRALDDTSAFASAMFGLQAGGTQLDCDPSESRTHLTASQMKGFLYSPLGDELAMRIQLQPAYQGAIESDLVIVNTAIGERGPETVECLDRMRQLVSRPSPGAGSPGRMLECRPGEWTGEGDLSLTDALQPMCCGGK